MAVKTLVALLLAASTASAGVVDTTLLAKRQSVDACPGYTASNVQTTGSQITGADLTLAGTACNTYGTDLTDLKLLVEYQTREHQSCTLYVAKITDTIHLQRTVYMSSSMMLHSRSTRCPSPSSQDLPQEARMRPTWNSQ